MVFYTIRSASTPSLSPYGIGGDANTIWHCDYNTDLNYELSTTDFSVVRFAASPSSYPSGIGGDANTIWHCDIGINYIYELSTTDFSVVRSAASPSSEPTGIGGDANTIWHCDRNTDRNYELSTTDFSVVRFAASPSSEPTGIGGNVNTIWHCEYDTNLILELDELINEITYYFDSRATSNWTDPDKMIDNILTNYASTSSDGTVETLDDNTAPGTNLGPVGQIYLRTYGYGDDNDGIGLKPKFSAGDGTEVVHIMGTVATWSSYQCITSDTNAPSPWTWGTVQGLDTYVYKRTTAKANVMNCAKVEIIVTYTPSAEGVTRSYGFIF